MAAKSGKWKVIKTSGGYGVIRRAAGGSSIVKSTPLRPENLPTVIEHGVRAQSATQQQAKLG